MWQLIVRIGLKFTTAGSSELCVTVIITLLTAAYSRTEFTEMFSLTSQLLLRRLETRHCSLDDRCCCCGAVAAGRRRLPLSINLSCSRGAQLQMMGQTDRQTDAPPLQRSCPADYAGAAKKWWLLPTCRSSSSTGSRKCCLSASNVITDRSISSSILPVFSSWIWSVWGSDRNAPI